MKKLEQVLDKLLYRPYGMLFWVIGFAVQLIYFVLVINQQTNGTIPICVNPVGKVIGFLSLSWLYAVAIGGSYQFGLNLNKGVNKRGESKGSMRPVYFNLFISALFIAIYVVTYNTECTK